MNNKPSFYTRKIKEQKSMIILFVAAALMPPDDLNVDEWAEKSLELSPRVTRYPGPIRLDRNPYLIEPLRSFKESRRTVIIFGAQLGKTLVIQICMGYIIDQDPGPTMIVYPDQATAKRRSKKHLQTLIDDSTVLSSHKTTDRYDMQLFEYTLDRMTINMAWSGSPSVLASEPIRYLLRDEIGKFKESTDKEADAMSLSERRTISYAEIARILDATTPTVKNAAGWKDLEDGTFEKLYLPCPFCGEYQILVFAQIKYPSQEKGEEYFLYKKRILKETYYECVSCQGKIRDMHKRKMLSKWDWRAKNPEAPYRSFNLPSWYAPWVKFGEVAKRFVDSKDDPEKLKDWINSDCAEPWEEKGENADIQKVLAHKLDYPPCTIPLGKTEPFVLVITADVQKDYIWYKVRAHTINKSYLVKYGTLAVPSDLEMIKAEVFMNTEDIGFCPEITLIDSGHRTNEVYQYASETLNTIALKGQKRQSQPVKWQKIESYPGTNKKMEKSINLCHVDTIYFKEEMLLEIDRGIIKGYDNKITFEPDLGSWFLHSETGIGYARQITAETVITSKDKKGYEKRSWKKVGKHNHLLDCEVYQLAARWVLKGDLRERHNQGRKEDKDDGRRISYQSI